MSMDQRGRCVHAAVEPSPKLLWSTDHVFCHCSCDPACLGGTTTVSSGVMRAGRLSSPASQLPEVS